MAQYLSPGVYVEEISGPRTIEGVSTSTAAFVGPTRMGPIQGTPTVLTCLADYVAIYGSLDELVFVDGDGESFINYVGQSVREFFDNQGQLLYVSRIYNFPTGIAANTLWPGGPELPAGYAYALQGGGSPPSAGTIAWTGRYPGSGGNVALLITLTASPNVLALAPSPTNPATLVNAIRGAQDYDVVWIAPAASTSPPSQPGAGGAFYWAESYLNTATGQTSWRFHPASGSPLELASINPGMQAFIFKANMQITYYEETNPRTDFFSGITFDPDSPYSFAQQFGPDLPDQTQQLQIPVAFQFSDTSDAAGIEIAEIMLASAGVTATQVINATPAQATVVLEGGLDGNRPLATDYQGVQDPNNPQNKTGLYSLEDLTEVAIVAAPGSTYEAGSDPSTNLYMNALQTTFSLIAHCEKMAYRIAVLDSPDGYSVSQISAWRGQIDSSYAALYYPWVKILDPVSNTAIMLPPSGFVAGIYARSDEEVGPHKAPANEVVTDALGFEVMLNKGQQDILNPLGVNCFRYFTGRGYLLWGARTATSDTEWMYVNLRRYMNYLKHSIDVGTQYVVFENNGTDTWNNTQQIVSDFLYDEFRNGRLFGATIAQAFFVRCDLTTMTQNDIANGRLICLIGVALLRPAEFVIFRIGQFTANSTNGS